MNFLRLQMFHAVAKHGSYSQTARELFISQPAVSKQVRELERELGVELFNHLGRRIHLTEAGRIVYAYADRVLALTDETRCALVELERLERGCLPLGATPSPGTYLLPAILASFREAYPALDLTLEIAPARELQRQLYSHELELAILASEPDAAELHVQPLGREPMVLVASQESPLARKSALTTRDLERETFLLREQDSESRGMLEAALQQLSLTPRQTMELNGVEAVKRAVAAGLGISLFSWHAVAAELERGELHELRLPELRLERRLNLVRHRGTRTSAAALSFAAFFQKNFVPPPATLTEVLGVRA